MSGSQPLRVLLIDIGNGCAARLEPSLQGAGLRTFLVEDCSDLLIEVRQGQFDVVLVNSKLPQVDQTDLPKIIRHINNTEHLPIIWLADHITPVLTTQALELGIDLVLPSESSLDVILSYILTLVRKKRRIDELVNTTNRLQDLLADQAKHVNQLRSHNDQLRELSTRDPLTKVHNARYMRQWLGQALAYAWRHNKPLSIMLLDIDHFKWINDCCGHVDGDEALRSVARILRNSVRDSDLVARYGGDEFLVALPNTSSKMLQVLAERILADVNRIPVGKDGKTLLSCSLGSATYPTNAQTHTYDEFIRLADQALYAAKRSGRGRLAQWCDLPPPHRQAVHAKYGDPGQLIKLIAPVYSS